MGRPRVVEVREKKSDDAKPHKKPKVVEEKDYSLLIEKRGAGNVLIGKEAERQIDVPVDAARDRLREDALADIIPVSPPLADDELKKRIEQDRKSREGIGKKLKKIMGFD
ncbi:MAG: hypothetical protein ABH863_06030 [Candidatus Micrarchaeota archaeon]